MSKRILIVSDVHIPYHDVNAVEESIGFTRAYRPDEFIFNGDLVDFEAFCRFLKDPRKVSNPQEELDTAKRLLSRYTAAIGPKCHKVFLDGNHEERLEKYLMRNAPAVLSLRSLNLVELLGLEGWTVLPYPQFYRSGKLIVHHGVSYGPTTNAKNISRFGGFDIVQGHSHRLSQTYVTSLHGRHSAAEGGCLCLLDQPYSKHNNWQHGWVTHDSAGLHLHAAKETR